MNKSNFSKSVKKLADLLLVINKYSTSRKALLRIADNMNAIRRFDREVKIDAILLVVGEISVAGSEKGIEGNKIETKQIEQHDKAIVIERLILLADIFGIVMIMLVGFDMFSEQPWFADQEALSALVTLVCFWLLRA